MPMKSQDQRIANAIEELEANLSQTARVEEWAKLMGYKCPKKFARKFLRYYSVRPKKMLEYIRLKEITSHLRNGRSTNFEIARRHGIPDEIALNKFINYHVGCSPSDVKKMTDKQVMAIFEKFSKKIPQKKPTVKSGNKIFGSKRSL